MHSYTKAESDEKMNSALTNVVYESLFNVFYDGGRYASVVTEVSGDSARYSSG